MATTRESILQALVALLEGSAFFPSAADNALLLDTPEPTAFRTLPVNGDGKTLMDCAAVGDAPEAEVTGQCLGGDLDPSADVCELNLKPSIFYLVAGNDRAARRARRDAAVAEIRALVTADRTLGLGHEVHVQIDQTFRDDELTFEGTPTVATLRIDLSIDYTAPDPAG